LGQRRCTRKRPPTVLPWQVSHMQTTRATLSASELVVSFVTDSISSLEPNESRIPDDYETLVDQFGNYADAYLKRTTNYSEALVHQIATMSCIIMFLTCIYGFASSLPNRLWQACSSASTWMAPAAGGRHTTTAGVCIMLVCCVLFTQLASTQARRPHTACRAW